MRRDTFHAILSTLLHLIWAAHAYGQVPAYTYHSHMQAHNTTDNPDSLNRDDLLLVAEVDPSLCLKTLNSSEMYDSETPGLVADLIKALQENLETDSNELFDLERSYLGLMRAKNIVPESLEKRLANDPDFFRDRIRILYGPKSDDESSEKRRTRTRNIDYLLYKWRIPPGTREDGSFSGENFSLWFDAAKDAFASTELAEMALLRLGRILVHCPSDPDGLWIDRAVAEALNSEAAQVLRDGLKSGFRNSRGAGFLDPSGKPEKDLAGKYGQMAEDAENAGYQRLAADIREISDYYDDDSERVNDSQSLHARPRVPPFSEKTTRESNRLPQAERPNDASLRDAQRGVFPNTCRVVMVPATLSRHPHMETRRVPQRTGDARRVSRVMQSGRRELRNPEALHDLAYGYGAAIGSCHELGAGNDFTGLVEIHGKPC